MKHTRTVSTLAALAAIGATPSALAQDTLLIERVPYVNVGQFFVALLAGLLLAIGFQILLGALTTAIGFSSLPNLVKRAENPPYPIGKKNADSSDKKSSQEDSSDSSGSSDPSFPMVKITSAFGIWTMLTASISLFFACWLAVYLGVVATPLAAVAVGLVVWATFFTLAAILEVKSITTLVGSLTSAVATGIRASVGAIGSATRSSPEQKLQQVADHTIDKVTRELGQSMRDNDLPRKLDEYIDQLSPPEIDFQRVRDELEDLINDIEVEENFSLEDDEAKRHLILNVLSRQPRFSKRDLAKAKSIFSVARDIQSRGGSPSDKVSAAIDTLTPGDEQAGPDLRNRIEEHLRNADREELEPDAIKADLDSMAEDPKGGAARLRKRLSSIDREAAKSILSARGDIGEERAEKIVATVENVVSKLKERFGSGKEQTQAIAADSGRRGSAMANEARSSASGISSKVKSIPDRVRSRIEDTVTSYIARIDRPELSEDALRRDFERIMDNPRETPEVLRERLQELDRDSVVAALAARENVSQEQAERMADKAIEARDSLMKRLHKIELAAKEKYYQSRYTLLKELEHLRRTGAAAAWWLLGTAVISGAAAAGGALAGATFL